MTAPEPGPGGHGPAAERAARIAAEAAEDIDAPLRLYGYPPRQPGQPLPPGLTDGGAGWLLSAITQAAAHRVDTPDATPRPDDTH